MSNEFTYKKLADLSFTDLYVEGSKEEKTKNHTAVGRLYAKIHRSSSMIPHSLRMNDESDHDTNVLMASQDTIETFVIPTMRYAE